MKYLKKTIMFLYLGAYALMVTLCVLLLVFMVIGLFLHGFNGLVAKISTDEWLFTIMAVLIVSQAIMSINKNGYPFNLPFHEN